MPTTIEKAAMIVRMTRVPNSVSNSPEALAKTGSVMKNHSSPWTRLEACWKYVRTALRLVRSHESGVISNIRL